MEITQWTVARFPDGSWTTGGKPDSPDYESCEVWVVNAENRTQAKRRAQYLRRKYGPATKEEQK